MAMNHTACDFIDAGGLGELKVVEACNYPSSKRFIPLPEQPIPEGLDWDIWQGPTELPSVSGRLLPIEPP